jgi:PAS domain S-box-containing protein
MHRRSETPMWMVDANTFQIKMANRDALKLFGYSEDELRSKTVFDLVVPEQADALRAAFDSRPFAGDGGSWTVRLPDGARFSMRVRYHFIQNEGARLQFTFADEIHGHPDFPEGKTGGVGDD